MKFIKIIKRLIAKATIIGLAVSLLVIPPTSAFYNDVETSEANNFTASSLDMGFVSGTSNFVPDTLLPGETASRSATVQNLANLAFEYNQAYQETSGDPDLCAALQLTVKDELNAIVYSGVLTGFNYTFPGTLAMGDTDDYSYFVSLPVDADSSLGNKTCTFAWRARAWQIGGSYGSGFYDEEILTNTINSGTWAWVNGQKFNDENGNGIKDGSETGLEDWTIYAGTVVDNFSVNSNGTPVTTVTLENGQKYFVRVSGTFLAGDNITADAKYSVRVPNTIWTDSVQNYESYGPTLLDLQIDAASPDWGSFNDDHIYWLTLNGDGGSRTFRIYDIYYPNNVGSLQVTIYQVIAEDQTDSEGNYQLDLTSFIGSVVIAERTQNGWVQTLPGGPNGYYSLIMPATISNQDFGNQQIETPPPPPGSSPIVLNEIMYNPTGSDNAPMPSGEWVELYNNSGVAVDVAGWRIQEDDSDFITISTSNSDNNLNTSDGGETVIPANGWLVVYRDGDTQFILTNGGDTVTLYDASNNLIDSHTYAGNKTEGSSEARVPDGTGSWVDPFPTPGRANVIDQKDLEPQVKIWQQDIHHLKIGIFDALNYDKAAYTITYYHTEEGMTEPQQEAIMGSIVIDELEEFVQDLYLGTCSAGGTCVPHHNIEDISLTVVLTGSGGIPDRTLGVNLN